MGGLFIIKAAVLLQLAAQLYGGVGIGESVQPDDDSGVGATGRAGGGHPQLLVFEQAVAAPGHPVALQVKIGRIGLYAGTALGHRLAGDLGTVLGIDHGGAHRAPAKLYLAGIAAQLAVGLAAQQLVGRHAQRLAADILQGNVDGADGGKHDDPAAQAPKRLAVERVPHRFAVHGVHAEATPASPKPQMPLPVLTRTMSGCRCAPGMLALAVVFGAMGVPVNFIPVPYFALFQPGSGHWKSSYRPPPDTPTKTTTGAYLQAF